jgi:hypothetical protein
MKKILFSIIFVALLLFSILLTLSFLSKIYFLKKKDFLLQNNKQIEFYEKYYKILHHLRGTDPCNLKCNSVEEFIFTKFVYNEKNNKTILIQGDSRAEGISVYAVNKWVKEKNIKKKKINIINSGTSSYSPSAQEVQLNLLINDFQIKPSTIILLIDPTDIGDESCRYKDQLIFDSKKKLIAIKNEKKPNNIYYYDYTLLGSKIYNSNFLKSIMYMPDFIYSISRKKTEYFFGKRNECPFSEIQKYLISDYNYGNAYFIERMRSYINNFLKYDFTEKLYIVTYPHIQHLDNGVTYGMKYSIKTSDLVEEAIKNIETKKKIVHINFYKENIFPELKNKSDYYKYFVKDDLAAHLTDYANKIFYKKILERISF